MSALSLRLPESLHRKLAAVADREGVSINQLISSAVAMSRARSHLRHYGIVAKPSDFISKVVPPLNSVRNFPFTAAPGGVGKHWVVPVAAGTSGAIDADELSRFDRCPRRFLYTYLLGLAGRQRETPFVRTHAQGKARSVSGEAGGMPVLGVDTTVVCSQAGASFGTRFWKKLVPPAPSGNRCRRTGRPPMVAISGSRTAS